MLWWFSAFAQFRTLDQGFPTFFAARTPLSGQSILSTPKKILRYILLYKRYISCSVTQGSSYPLGVRVPPVGNPCLRWKNSWSPGSLRDLITTTVSLNRKLGYLSFQKKIKNFQKHILSKAFPMLESERMFFAKRQLQTTKWKNAKINCKTSGVPSQI